jgi:hypothetical protein
MVDVAISIHIELYSLFSRILYVDQKVDLYVCHDGSYLEEMDSTVLCRFSSYLSGDLISNNPSLVPWPPSPIHQNRALLRLRCKLCVRTFVCSTAPSGDKA